MTEAVAEKGFAYLPQRNALKPDYAWIVKNSILDMKETAVRLQAEAKRLGYSDVRRLHGLIASFVQSMPYKIPPAMRSDAGGRKIFIGGVTMPLETLYRGYGDCDTKSVLFASIMKNFRETDVVFLAGNQHMFAAVPMEPRMYDSYIILKGKKYLLIELTQPWHLGHVPREHLNALRLKKLEVMSLAE